MTCFPINPFLGCSYCWAKCSCSEAPPYYRGPPRIAGGRTPYYINVFVLNDITIRDIDNI